MCGRSDAAKSLREAAEALTRACEDDAIGCDLRLVYPVPHELPADLRALVVILETIPEKVR